MNLHSMGDLETWGRTPGSDIRSIGFVMFDITTGEFGEEFYIAVEGGEAYGLTREPATVQWWSEQSAEAQAAFENPVDLKEGLQRLSDWFVAQNVTSYADPVRYTRFWAHGPHFDEQILAAAFRAVGVPVPWNYRAPRDLRTMLEAAGLDPKNDIPNYGTEHNALDDAKAQALGVSAAYRKLAAKTEFKAIEREVIRELIGNYGTEIKELRDRRDGLLEANNREVEERRLLARQLVELRQAGTDLYLAGRWSCDKPVDAAGMWTRFRDALGLQPGTATALGIGQDTPSRYEQLAGAVRNLRAAQRTYLADRGNEELGKAVGIAAAEVDRILGDA